MIYRIENWSKRYHPNDSMYVAPEVRTICLQGFILGRELDGIDATVLSCTNGIKGKRDGRVVTESGNEYELGEIDPKYELAYPGAKQKMLESLPEI